MTTGRGERFVAGARRWWREGPLSRPGARRRYTSMLAVIAVLVSLPALVGALPVDAKPASVASLLARVRVSEQVPFSGLASSTGQLEVPDLGVGTDVVNLLSSTSRLRAWWAGPQQYRVDRVTAVGESGVYRDGAATWTWDSGKRLAIRTTAAPQIPLPGPQDALPSSLTRRLLADTPANAVSPIAARRIAGRTALGLKWKVHDKRSSIGEVKAWVDQKTGLPLALEVKPAGSNSRAFRSSFLDISFQKPSPARWQFNPGHDSSDAVDDTEAGDANQTFNPTRLPATLATLRQRSPARPLVATYGEGASLVAVASIDALGARALRQQIDSPSHPAIQGKFGEGSLIETPLLNGLVFASGGSGYVLLGSVTRAQLEAMALDLSRLPPVNNGGSFGGPVGHRP